MLTGPAVSVDRRGRSLKELRVSVTDRCNFRCRYCMPRESFGPGFRFLPRTEILTFEEIARVCRLFVSMGVEKLRLTGGEPLLRRELPRLVEMLKTPGVDLALTTNGSRLSKLASDLAAAGLERITVSLDSLNDRQFRRMADTDCSIETVLHGIDAAARAGLSPVKINAVIQRHVNDDQILPLATHFKGSGHVLRFIEFMDVGSTNGWQATHVLSADEIIARVMAVYPLDPILERQVPAESAGDGQRLPAGRGESGVAQRFRYRDGSGEIGVIASVTRPFCGSCTRARLSADGVLYTCLFATDGLDLRRALRSGLVDVEIEKLIKTQWTRREDRYSELRAHSKPHGRCIEMSYIGG